MSSYNPIVVDQCSNLINRWQRIRNDFKNLSIHAFWRQISTLELSITNLLDPIRNGLENLLLFFPGTTGSVEKFTLESNDCLRKFGELDLLYQNSREDFFLKIKENGYLPYDHSDHENLNKQLKEILLEFVRGGVKCGEKNFQDYCSEYDKLYEDCRKYPRDDLVYKIDTLGKVLLDFVDKPKAICLQNLSVMHMILCSLIYYKRDVLFFNDILKVFREIKCTDFVTIENDKRKHADLKCIFVIDFFSYFAAPPEEARDLEFNELCTLLNEVLNFLNFFPEFLSDRTFTIVENGSIKSLDEAKKFYDVELRSFVSDTLTSIKTKNTHVDNDFFVEINKQIEKILNVIYDDIHMTRYLSPHPWVCPIEGLIKCFNRKIGAWHTYHFFVLTVRNFLEFIRSKINTIETLAITPVGEFLPEISNASFKRRPRTDCAAVCYVV